MGFCVLMSLVGVFTYANFYLAAPPFRLSSAALGSIFFVYLLGLVVTPLAGKFLDRSGFRNTALLALGMSVAGLLLTLVHSLPVVVAGLAFFSSGVFVSQSAATVQTGRVAGRSRSSAAGLYVTFYYIGGSIGATVPAWFWAKGGWPACVALLTAVSLITLVLGVISSGAPVVHPEPDLVPENETYFD
jgi:MFS family permease